MIPLVDLDAHHRAHRDELDTALGRFLASNVFIGGAEYEAFADEFAKFCGGGHVALCGSGTDALYLTLMELLGPGDGHGEVITVSNTFIATAEAITLAHYCPVFVDVESDSLLMDVSLIEQAITPRTRAILPVHLYGQMVAMDLVMRIANRHNLVVIEDSAQAHGASWQGKGPGVFGNAACFSFYPAKNLGAWGDGGAVFSRDQELIERIRMRADHGRKTKYEHEFLGVNSRLDGIQAAILRVKLRHLADWNTKRRQVAAWYNELLGGLDGIHLPTVLGAAEHVFHLYVVQVDERDRILRQLREKGVGAGAHYPIPVHEQPAYAHLGIAPEALPVTHAIARRVLSLPIYPEIREEQVRTVVTLLGSCLQGRHHK